MGDQKRCPHHGEDVVHLGPELEDGGHPYVRHHPDGSVRGGVLRLAAEGMPLYDGALQLRHRGPGPIFNVTNEYKREVAQPECPGPAKVATPAYRTGWDNIFGNRTVGQA